jgi:hypothetical protein
MAQPDRSRRHREAAPHPELVYQRPFGLCEGRSADHFTVVYRFRSFPVDEPTETVADPGEGIPPISGVLGPPIGTVNRGRLEKDETPIDTGGEDAAPCVTVAATPSSVGVRRTSTSMQRHIEFRVPRKTLEASSRAQRRAESVHYCGQPAPKADAAVLPGECLKFHARPVWSTPIHAYREPSLSLPGQAS